MAWYVDGFSPAEIAQELAADPAAVRQNLAKARRNLKKSLGIIGRGPDEHAGRERLQVE
jgi:RNA polymerase sigma-70 factor (ECF subfamily)